MTLTLRLAKRSLLPRILATAATLAGLSSGAVSAETVLAVAAPLKGRQGVVGQQIVRAVEKAAADLKAKGLAGMDALRVVIEDDGCSAEGARAAAQKLVALKPAVVIGHPCDGAAIAAADIYRKEKVLYLAPATRHPALTDVPGNATVFRLAGRDDAEGAAAGERLAQAAPAKRVAIVQDRTRYARTLTEGAKRALAAKGILQPTIVPIVAGQRGYPAAAAQAMSTKPEAVYFAGFPTEAALVIADLRQAGFSGPVIVCGAVDTPDFQAAAKENRTAWGDVEVMRPEMLRPARTAAALETSLAGLPAPARAAYLASYAAVEVWALALERAKAAGPVGSVASALHAAPLEPTVIGMLRFDGKGDAEIASFAAHDLNAGQPVTAN